MSNRTSLYAVEDGKLVRKNETCPKCGPGVFLANHPDRKSCGRCGFNPTAGAAPAVEEPAPAVEEAATEAPVEAAAEEVATETESEVEADATEAEAEATEAEADESKEE
ncbi:MAG: 30S ribosomal protein S27ae [Methanobacteriota archaeon]|nr:MAG: 30S ribosomal protein S27ae [Euryarchaeota archaeon]